jgi:hypothetical protein
LLGCSQLLTLGELEKADCVSADCGSNGGSAGMRTYKAGASSGGSSNAQTAGRSSTGAVPGGGSSPDGGNSADMMNGGSAGTNGGSSAAGSSSGGIGISGGGGGSSSGNAGTAGNSPSGGSSGSDSGGTANAGTAGVAMGGTGGQTPLGGCTPSATDQSCDGLDRDCQPTDSDVACSAFCVGSFVDGSSYMSCVDAASFDEAAAACAQNGMKLTRIDSEQENETVWSIALDDYVWLGGSNRADQTIWVWPDGVPFLSNGAAVGDTYESFEPGQPADSPDYRCAEMDANGWWSNWYCDEPQSYVCERY